MSTYYSLAVLTSSLSKPYSPCRSSDTMSLRGAVDMPWQVQNCKPCSLPLHLAGQGRRLLAAMQPCRGAVLWNSLPGRFYPACHSSCTPRSSGRRSSPTPCNCGKANILLTPAAPHTHTRSLYAETFQTLILILLLVYRHFNILSLFSIWP